MATVIYLYTKFSVQVGGNAKDENYWTKHKDVQQNLYVLVWMKDVMLSDS